MVRFDKKRNAKSEMEGLAPCYHVAEKVYRKGKKQSVICDGGGEGCRLPYQDRMGKGCNG